MRHFEIGYGLVYGLCFGFNYFQVEGSNEGEYQHVIQLLLGFFMIEVNWISKTYIE